MRDKSGLVSTLLLLSVVSGCWVFLSSWYPAWYVALLWLRYMKKMHPRSDSKLLERKALGNLGVPWHPALGIKAGMSPTVPLRFLHTPHFPPTFAQPGVLFLSLLVTPLPSSFSGARQNGDIAATPFLFSLRNAFLCSVNPCQRTCLPAPAPHFKNVGR